MAKATKANVTKAMNAAGIPGTIWYDTCGRCWYGVDKFDVLAGDEFWTMLPNGTDLFPSLQGLTTDQALDQVIYRATNCGLVSIDEIANKHITPPAYHRPQGTPGDRQMAINIEDRDTAARRIDATEITPGVWVYLPDEVNTHYTVTDEDLEKLGRDLRLDVADAYSLWCSVCGDESTADEIEALQCLG